MSQPYNAEEFRLALQVFPELGDLLNALNVSFVENIDFEGPRGPVAWEYVPSGWKLASRSMHRYLEDLARLPTKKKPEHR